MQASVELSQKFSVADWVKGKKLFLAGGVSDVVVGSDTISARVEDRGRLKPRLELGPDGWSAICTCPAGKYRGSCRHTFALFCAALSLEGPLSEQLEALRGTPAEDKLLRFPSYSPSRYPRDRAWSWADTGKSDLLLGRLERLGFNTRESSGSAEIAYVLGAAPVGVGKALITVAAPRRDHLGQLEDLVTGLGASKRERLGKFDLRMIELLEGGRDPWNSGFSSSHQLVRAISPTMQSQILPELASAGRLYFEHQQSVRNRPLVLDSEGSWLFGLSVENSGGQLSLKGLLRRGEQSLAFGDVLQVLHGGFAVRDQSLLQVDWQGAEQLADLMLEEPQLEFPSSSLAQLLRFLARVPLEISIEGALQIQQIDCEPQPVLFFAAPEGSKKDIRVRIDFEYSGQRLARGGPCTVVNGTCLTRIARRTELEFAREAEFEACGGKLYRTPREGFSGSLSLETLATAVQDLTRRGWRIEAEGKRLRASSSWAVNVSTGIDWFDLEAKIEFADQVAELPALLAALEARTNLVRLADGTLGLLPEHWLEQWGLLLRAGQVQEKTIRFEKSRAFLLDALLAERESVAVDHGFDQIRQRLARARTPKPASAPKKFFGELRPYQQEGLGWLRFLEEIGLGGCLADDMGLGKTVQLLAFALERRKKADHPMLVVAPRTLLFNWEQESQRFAPSIHILLHHGQKRSQQAAELEQADLVLTTYGTLLRDVELLSSIQFDLIVLDEAQTIKNSTSQSAKSAKLLRGDLRVALTGTPVENRIADLLSIFEFLNPGLLESSRVLRRVLEQGDEQQAARFAARALAPFLLRRTKEQVLKDLPPKTEQLVTCELEGKQKTEYASLRDHYRRTLLARVDQVGLEKSRMNVLEALLRLRQAACHLALVDKEHADVPSAKMEALLPMLEEITSAGHKALVFSQFTSFLAHIRSTLDARGIAYEYLDGKTRNRATKVARFQDSDTSAIFLISLKAGGLGLNLTQADYVFLLDPWWNPAVERQAIDRSHRIGQTRAVTAYRLVARDTVEEKVLTLQAHKKAVAEALFDGEARALKNLTREDLEWVLS